MKAKKCITWMQQRNFTNGWPEQAGAIARTWWPETSRRSMQQEAHDSKEEDNKQQHAEDIITRQTAAASGSLRPVTASDKNRQADIQRRSRTQPHATTSRSI